MSRLRLFYNVVSVWALISEDGWHLSKGTCIMSFKGPTWYETARTASIFSIINCWWLTWLPLPCNVRTCEFTELIWFAPAVLYGALVRVQSNLPWVTHAWGMSAFALRIRYHLLTVVCPVACRGTSESLFVTWKHLLLLRQGHDGGTCFCGMLSCCAEHANLSEALRISRGACQQNKWSRLVPAVTSG